MPAHKTSVFVPCAHCHKIVSKTPSQLAAGELHFCSREHLYAYRRQDEIQRFWSKIDTSGGPDACWPWLGSLNKGYGQFHTRIAPGKTKKVPAHRYMFELLYGLLPQELNACHNCPDGDLRTCCNPKHLFAGTQKENVHDAVNKGRIKTGQASPSAKLTDNDVHEIRQMYARATHTALAEHYSVSVALISLIQRRKIWTHIL